MKHQYLPQYNAGVGSEEAPATLHNAPRVVSMAKKSSGMYATSHLSALRRRSPLEVAAKM
jgi:hypothetical protein